jgi:hypothetical protein
VEQPDSLGVEKETRKAHVLQLTFCMLPNSFASQKTPSSFEQGHKTETPISPPQTVVN